MSRSECPKCHAPMEQVEKDGLRSNTCTKCEGTWVDIAVAEHLGYGVAEAHELVQVFTALTEMELVPSEHACPGCSKPLLLGEYGGVEVDACPDCRGLYLDRFEFAGIIDPSVTPPCPKCQAPMAMEDLGDVPTHACPSCSGRWLSVPVLEHLSDPSATAELTCNALIRTFTAAHGSDTRDTSFECPTCDDRLRACDHQGIELDFCFRCRGLFLDQGEMQEVTNRYSTSSERAVASVQDGPARALEALVEAVGKLTT